MTGEPVRLFRHLGAAALLALLGIPLARNCMDPDHWYGFRNRQRLSEIPSYGSVDEMTGWWMVAPGARTLLVVIAFYTLGVDAGLAAPINLMPIMFGMIIHGAIMIRQLARTMDETQSIDVMESARLADVW